MSQSAATSPPLQSAPRIPDDGAPPVEGTLGPQIDALLDQMESGVADASEAIPHEGVPSRAEPEAAGFAASVDETIERSRRALGEPSPATVDQLDEALARDAEERMSDPVEDPGEGVASNEPFADAPLTEAMDAGPSESAEEEDDESVIVPVVVSASPEPPQAAPSPAGPSPAVACVRASPGPIRVLGDALSWPMRLLPPSVRDLLGWLSLVTLFNAGCIWIYLLI